MKKIVEVKNATQEQKEAEQRAIEEEKARKEAEEKAKKEAEEQAKREKEEAERIAQEQANSSVYSASVSTNETVQSENPGTQETYVFKQEAYKITQDTDAEKIFIQLDK